MSRKLILAAVAAGALALPATAGAHVTLQPEEAPAGGFTRLDVRVPKRDDRGTRRVEVEMPPGFLFVSYEPRFGWRAQVTRRTLDRPVEAFGEQISEEVDRVVFTATSSRHVIPPGGFVDFGLSIGVPEGRAGTKLTFKALQTYAGGEVVRWIGAPDADLPAPQVTLTRGAGASGAHGDTPADGAAAPVSAGGGDGGGASTALVAAAIALGALGLMAGAAGLLASRRRLAS